MGRGGERKSRRLHNPEVLGEVGRPSHAGVYRHLKMANTTARRVPTYSHPRPDAEMQGHRPPAMSAGKERRQRKSDARLKI